MLKIESTLKFVSVMSRKRKGAPDLMDLFVAKCDLPLTMRYSMCFMQFKCRRVSAVGFVHTMWVLLKTDFPEVWAAFTKHHSDEYEKWEKYNAFWDELRPFLTEDMRHEASLILRDKTRADEILDGLHALLCGKDPWTAPTVWTVFPGVWEVLVRNTRTTAWHKRVEKKEADRRKRLAEATTPTSPLSNVDLLRAVAAHLPLRSFRDLATTCVWVHVHVKKGSVFELRSENAAEFYRRRFGDS